MAFKINAPFHREKNHQDGRDNRNEKSKQKSQVTIDGEAGYDADDKARKNKTGIYAPKQKKTREKAKTVASNSKGADIKVTKVKAEKPKVSSAKPTVKAAAKSKSVKKKEARISKTRDKGAKAAESGNISKARRLQARERRLKKRLAKKSKK